MGMSRLTDAPATPAGAAFRPLLSSAHIAFTTFTLFTVFAGNFWRNLVGWYAWGAIVVAIIVVSIVWIVRAGLVHRLRHLPLALLAFVAYALASALWSNWPLETLLGSLVLWLTIIIALPLAAVVSWEELLVAFSAAMRWIVGLSLAFELIVSTIIRHPVLPVYITGTTVEDSPLMVLWSRNLLFVDGKIQGILGNSSMLAYVALLGVIALGVQFAAGRIGRISAGVWAVLFIGTLALTRSATTIIAAVVVLAVLAIVLVRRRLVSRRARAGFAIGVVVAAAVAGILVATFWTRILALFGKSGDLTGRVEIWQNVIGLAVQRPAFGWGWLGYWPPWVEPLGSLNKRWGVFQLHAHDAWIDLWMQVGIVGLVIFALIVLTTVLRGLYSSTHRVWHVTGKRLEFSAVTLLPILVMTMLVVQSITESRFLVEEGLLMLCILAIKLKLDPFLHEEPRATVIDRRARARTIRATPKVPVRSR